METDVLKADFNPLIRPYLVLYVGMWLTVTIILIPLALVWFLGIGQWWARHYFEKLECELGRTAIRYRKGILFQVEKTIPLENIQDITFIEGPILRRFHLSILKFETAGQAHGQAHNMRLVGIVEANAFRNHILERREAVKHHFPVSSGAEERFPDNEHVELLRAIQLRLDEIISLMQERH